MYIPTIQKQKKLHKRSGNTEVTYYPKFQQRLVNAKKYSMYMLLSQKNILHKINFIFKASVH